MTDNAGHGDFYQQQTTVRLKKWYMPQVRKELRGELVGWQYS